MHTFYTNSDDGSRLWVNGQQLIDDWNPHPRLDRSGSVQLVAGQIYSLELQYMELDGGAYIQLSWESACHARETIPSSQLYPCAVPSIGSGSGLTATYYSDNALGTVAMTRVDPTVNFDWQLGGPTAQADYFSVAWTGRVQPKSTGRYVFYTT